MLEKCCWQFSVEQVYFCNVLFSIVVNTEDPKRLLPLFCVIVCSSRLRSFVKSRITKGGENCEIVLVRIMDYPLHLNTTCYKR